MAKEGWYTGLRAMRQVILEVVEGSNLISVAMPVASAVRLAEMLRGKAEGR